MLLIKKPEGQAKIISRTEEKRILHSLDAKQNSERNKVMFLLTIKAGLRAKEVAGLRWSMVTDAAGEITDAISLTASICKGTKGRTIPLSKDLKQALQQLQKNSTRIQSFDPVILSARKTSMTHHGVVYFFRMLYKDNGLIGCSSHSGRRTFITRLANRIISVGGSLRDVQQMAGHSSLSITQSYIEGNDRAKVEAVNLI